VGQLTLVNRQSQTQLMHMNTAMLAQNQIGYDGHMEQGYWNNLYTWINLPKKPTYYNLIIKTQTTLENLVQHVV
jgi:hypothetical protein